MFWPSKEEQIEELNRKWNESERFKGIKRNYTAEDVVALRGSLKIENTIATAGAERLWSLLNSDPYVSTFGVLTGSQASQMVKAGLKSLYMSGWQVAGDGVGNTAGQTYPDQSLYPSNSVPTLVKTLNNALLRSDQISKLNGEDSVNWLAPIVADAEAGFGGPIHAFELMKNMIESGASGVHFEDQLAAEKKCGHMGGKVLVPTSQFINTLNAARLASDVLDVPTILIGRIDALDATLLTSDIDPRDRKFLTGERTAEGYFQVTGGMESTIGRGLAFAPYSDLLWFETSNPSLEEAKEFADAIHAEFPGKMMAYNCSPSFNWRANIDEKTTAEFRDQLAQMGYKYQFITLAGWHMINLNAFELAQEFKQEGMPAYVRLQDREFSQEENGYTATKHQQEVGAGFFDKVIMSITGGDSATTALAGSTESGQFN